MVASNKRAQVKVRKVAALTLGVGLTSVAAIACSAGDDRPEAIGSSNLPVLSLDAPTSVEAGAPSEREATCPGRKLPDQCGSWAGVELIATRDAGRHGGCDHGHGRSHDNDKHGDKHGDNDEHDDRHGADLRDSHCMCDPIEFAIPSELPVTLGRAGGSWDKASLTFRKPSGRFVECSYQGNGRSHHRGGDKYVFDRCSDGSKPGQTRQADWFELELEHEHPHAGPTQVQLRLGEPDVVDGVVQEQVFYASDPRIAGAALHVPRGSAPPFETFSLDRMAGLPPGTSIDNSGNPATTVTHVVDVHSDSTDHFVFTPVPGAACPRVVLPYDQAALEALVGPGGEGAIVAKDLSSLDPDSAVLTSANAVTVNLAQRTMSFCVEHLSLKAGAVGSFDSNLTGASIESVNDPLNPLSAGLLTGSLPPIIIGNTYKLTLTFANVSNVVGGDWDSGLNLVPASISSGAATISSSSTWGLVAPPWVTTAGPPLRLSNSDYVSTSAPGSVPHKTASATHTATFSFNITVPSSPAPLNFCLRSAGNATQAFGDCFTWDPSTETLPGTKDVNGATSRRCYSGAAGTLNKGECHAGTQTYSDGVWGSDCAGEVTPKSETCNGKNDDCDDATDEGVCVDDSTFISPMGIPSTDEHYDAFYQNSGACLWFGDRGMLFCPTCDGGTRRLKFGMKNTGGTTWTAGGGYQFMAISNNCIITDGATTLSSDVAPGQTAQFDLGIQCPACNEGSFSGMMVRAGTLLNRFGDRAIQITCNQDGPGCL